MNDIELKLKDNGQGAFVIEEGTYVLPKWR